MLALSGGGGLWAVYSDFLGEAKAMRSSANIALVAPSSIP